MKIRTLAGFALATLVASAAPASAQIISTMVPMEKSVSGGGGGGSAVAVHLMGGYSNWRFGFIQDSKDQPGTTLTGGQNGWIGAVDIAGAVGGSVSVGGGGWFNKVQDLKTTATGFTDTQTIAVASVYGNVFYKYVGVQAGIIPFKSKENGTAGITTFSGSDDQTDMDIFGVARFGAAKAGQPRWSASVGGGMYRYGARPADTTNGVSASPSAFAPTVFFNFSAPVAKHLSIDGSAWYTAKDKNYTTTDTIGNADQTRFVIGLGVQL
jgi:hypothetical protein